MKDYILPHIEWEVLHEPIIIPKVDDAKQLPKGQNRIEICRDERYNIQAVLHGKYDDAFIRRESAGIDIVPGSPIEPFEITGSDPRK